MPVKSVVQSVAHYVPQRIVTNDDLSHLMDTSDEWITERTGIRERRHIESDDITTSDLAKEAALEALDRANKRPGDIDLIIAATLSPDLYFPGIGTILQNKLGMSCIPALDIRAQCSGLVYGLSVADAFIKSGQARSVMLACAEIQSPVLDNSNKGRDMAVLFGDGAGVLIIDGEECKELPSLKNDERGIIDSVLGSDGSGAEVLCLKTPGTATPGFLRATDFEEGTWHPRMDGRTVFKHAVTRMCETAELILRRNNGTAEDVDLLLPHQANLRINEMVRDKLSIPAEKVFNNIHKYGNTTSATIPICMSEAEAEERLSKSDVVLTLAFGAGFTWGANLLRW